jgi:hypothetical protein
MSAEAKAMNEAGHARLEALRGGAKPVNRFEELMLEIWSGVPRMTFWNMHMILADMLNCWGSPEDAVEPLRSGAATIEDVGLLH